MLLKTDEIKLSPYYIAYLDILGISDAIKSENSEDYLNKISSTFTGCTREVENAK